MSHRRKKVGSLTKKYLRDRVRYALQETPLLGLQSSSCANNIPQPAFSTSPPPGLPVMTDSDYISQRSSSSNVTPSSMIMPSGSESEWASCSDADSTDAVPEHEGSSSKNPPPSPRANDESEGRPFDVNQFLREWSLTNNISHTALNRLLQGLKKHECFRELSVDSRTLLRTPRVCPVQTMEPGVYFHFGLRDQLRKFAERLAANISSIALLINVDGLPLSRSSTSALWPILGSVFGSSNVFLIGAYYGAHKPASADEYLKPFVDECSSLILEGLEVNGRKISFSIKGFICDAPAKSFLLGVKGHSGYNSCTKCDIEGDYIENRVCFPGPPGALRDDSNFRAQTDDEYHVRSTVIVQIPRFDVVRNFPLDYMHLVCLGVTKKLIILWMSGSLGQRLSSRQVQAISEAMNSFRPFMPREFVRKPRSLEYVRLFKATEFRNFLLYLGPVSCKNQLQNQTYDNFLVLHVAVRVLCSPELNETTVAYAQELLRIFVEQFESMYGQHQVSHNVHGLYHLGDDALHFGPLDSFSAFRFENYLQTIKRMIRKSEKPLQQLYMRFSELQTNADSIPPPSSQMFYNFKVVKKSQHSDGPLTEGCSGPQYGMIGNEYFQLRKSSAADSCFLSKKLEVVVLENIAFSKQTKKLVLIGRKFLSKRDLYDTPCQSGSLHIHVVSQVSPPQTWNIEDICMKMIKLPFERDFVVMPLLHSISSE